MKYLRKFNESLDDFPTDPKVIRDFCKLYKIRNYSIHDDGTVDVFGDCLLIRGDVSFSKLPIKFGYIEGRFTIYSRRLTTLEGCPHTVNEEFYCSGSKIKNLVGAPSSVGSITTFDSPFMTSLEGVPSEIREGFRFDQCPLLWDARPLEKVNFGKIGDVPVTSMNDTMIYPIVQLFASKGSIGFFSARSIKGFIDSLVYNYIRQPKLLPHGNFQPTLNLFRFKEALDDANIDIEKIERDIHDTFGKWIYLDDDGKRVNFDGKPIWWEI